MLHDALSAKVVTCDAEIIRIRGARVHNLKNVDLDIPRDQFTVITGPSGSGKSSLAFDTLFAEGQRQYVETLSIYARQFLDQLERPDVDWIDGLPPTLCIDQRRVAANPRSTVGTITEIYDHLRLLMARVGTTTCYECGSPICQQSLEQIQDSIMALPEGTKVMILAAMVRGRRGQHTDVLAEIRKAGLVRVRLNGEVSVLEDIEELEPRKRHHIEAVVDRVIIRPGSRSRIGESTRLAAHLGNGLVIACYATENKEAERGELVWNDELFSTLYACPRCGVNYEEIEPRTFSFNSPYGACETCRGVGMRTEFDPEMVLPDRSLSLAQGAIFPWKGLPAAATKKRQQLLADFLKQAKLSWEMPLVDVSDSVMVALLYGDGKGFLGLLTLLEKEFATTTSQQRIAQLGCFRATSSCRECEGSRLRPEARSVRLADQRIDEITKMPIDRAESFFCGLKFSDDEEPIGRPIVTQILRRLEFLCKVGVGYLSLDRSADTLSGGELQRVRLATSIGSGLVGVCYVLDEPSIGLHPRDNNRLIDALRDLQRQGNTVVVVEHDESMMRQADHLIDMGPGAGADGGEVLAVGTPVDLQHDRSSLTGRFLSQSETIPIPKRRRRVSKSRSIYLEGASLNNLREVSLQLPLGVLTCITGVSGSGKSSIINGTLAPAISRRLGHVASQPGSHRSLRGVAQIDKLINVDQSPIGRTPRSNPGTYTGVFDEIRKVFANSRDAKQRGYRVSRFSPNVKGGRCEACQGQGVQKIEMSFLPDLFVTCKECHGLRFNPQTLQVRYRGRTIGDVLKMAVNEASVFFENFPAIHRVLQSLCEIGLGYVPLGQPSMTLSGGEAQRIKLATELARVDTGRTLYLLDEPTIGLHFTDVRRLLEVLGALIDRGNSIVVIEHNVDVIKSADWVIDMGPGGGERGGQVIAAGTPEELVSQAESVTGPSLKAVLRAGGE